ncbi:hypothetical protein KY329_04690 [Candidatus Woesearchaeota archaeon]|nr:hypothetical protein [Candidatus Woesearchaeota archaeon]
MLWQALIIILAAYLMIIFVLSRIFAPYLGISRPKVTYVPKTMQAKINQLKKKYPAKKKYAKAAYDFLTKKNHGGQLTLQRLGLVFLGLDKAWKRDGYLPCNQLAYLYYVFITESKMFSKKDIWFATTSVNFCIHRYVKLRIDHKVYDVDLWGEVYGIPFGEHAAGKNI